MMQNVKEITLIIIMSIVAIHIAIILLMTWAVMLGLMDSGDTSSLSNYYRLLMGFLLK